MLAKYVCQRWSVFFIVLLLTSLQYLIDAANPSAASPAVTPTPQLNSVTGVSLTQASQNPPAAEPMLSESSSAPSSLSAIGLPESRPQDAPSFAQYPVCDVAFESTVCLFDQEHVILPPARPYGLVGHYTFDMIRPLDTSGHRNHALGATIASFPFGTAGASAMFRKSYLLIPHSTLFDSSDYSITFWMYILEDAVSRAAAQSAKPLEQWCPIIHKGVLESLESAGVSGHMEAKPSIQINPATGRLKITESTNEVEATEGEFFVGNFKLRPHRWYHIAYIRHQRRARLYVDGILDSTMLTKGLTRNNPMPYYIGGTPWTESVCDYPIALDELKIYAVPIGRDSIQAEAAPALSGMEPSAFFVSCIDCTRLQAEEGCPESFHLCTRLELWTGGYQVVQKLGLKSPGVTIFTGDTSAEAIQLEGSAAPVGEQGGESGVGLCCRDASN